MSRRKTGTPEEARQALLGQLAYLVDEIDALEGVIGSVPANLLEDRPQPDVLSVKETFGLIAAADRTIRLEWFQRTVEEDDPEIAGAPEDALLAGEDWKSLPVERIFRRMREGRRALTTYLEGLPPDAWSRAARAGDRRLTLVDLAQSIIQADMQYLREIGYRLHESNLFRRSPH